MTTFDKDGRMTSCFSPPRDEHGEVLSYADWRARAGIPIGPEEAAAKAEVLRLSEEYSATQAALPPLKQGERWKPNEAFFRLKDAEDRVSAISAPLYRAWEERRRADLGAPISDDERAARDAYFEIERSHSWPWTSDELQASNEASARWRAATAAAFEFWGVEDPDAEGEVSNEEWERRRATIARAKAGLTPMVPPHEVTYDDEPDFAVRVPLDIRPPSSGRVHASPVVDPTAFREIERWKAETACERETEQATACSSPDTNIERHD